MYQVLIPRGIEKRIEKADKRYQEAIFKAIGYLAANPLAGKLLTGRLKGQYSFRVGVYRLVYIFEPGANKLFITDFDHRKDVYRQ